MGTAKLGNYVFRLNPDQVSYAYQIDYATIDTIGGQVIQVLGATVGDITVSGSFGEQRGRTHRESWELAESFHTAMKRMMDAQTLPRMGSGSGITHQPIRFTFMDGVHNWDWKVLIKGIADGTDDGSIDHHTGKFSYHYTLTLFMVEDSTLTLKKVATDSFISRIASGLGWKGTTKFNGVQDLSAAIAFIQKNSPDGTFLGYLANLAEFGSGGPTVTLPGTNQKVQ
jgi:hypothetical protein